MLYKTAVPCMGILHEFRHCKLRFDVTPPSSGSSHLHYHYTQSSVSSRPPSLIPNPPFFVVVPTSEVLK